MNMHNWRVFRSVASSALMVTGVVTASGWLPAAHAGELEFAHKLLGSQNREAEGIQFRSTIIDPARPGKSQSIESRNFRVIPISNPAEITASKRNCNICGVVESISLNVRNEPALAPEDESDMENVVKSSGKSRALLLPTQHGGENTNNKPLKKNAPMYEVKVRMTDGTVRILNQPTQPEYAVGDYVRVISGAVTAA